MFVFAFCSFFLCMYTVHSVLWLMVISSLYKHLNNHMPPAILLNPFFTWVSRWGLMGVTGNLREGWKYLQYCSGRRGNDRLTGLCLHKTHCGEKMALYKWAAKGQLLTDCFVDKSKCLCQKITVGVRMSVLFCPLIWCVYRSEKYSFISLR